jgi:hypothetical protein
MSRPILFVRIFSERGVLNIRKLELILPRSFKSEVSRREFRKSVFRSPCGARKTDAETKGFSRFEIPRSTRTEKSLLDWSEEL